MWCECVISPKTWSNISAMKRWIQSLICEQIEDFEDSDDEEEEAEEFQDCVEYNSPSEDSSGVCGAGSFAPAQHEQYVVGRELLSHFLHGCLDHKQACLLFDS